MFNSTAIASLFIELGADASKVQSALKQTSEAIKSTGEHAKTLGDYAKEGFGMATGFSALGAVEGAFDALKRGVIETNAELQQSTLAWGILLGSTDKAKTKMEELTKFSTQTPFRFSELNQAARTMETFGGAALDTIPNLKLFGDASAATQAPLERLTFWSSRLYDALDSGKPIGMSIMELQHMAVISGKTGNELSKLQKEGVAGPEIWKKYQESLGKFAGTMQAQSNSLTGAISTFKDIMDLSIAKAGKPIFEVVNQSLVALNDLLGSGSVDEAITTFADNFANGLHVIGDAFGTVIDFAKSFSDAMNAFGDGTFFDKLANGLFMLLGDMGLSNSPIPDFINKITYYANAAWEKLKQLTDLLGGFSSIGNGLGRIVEYMAGFAAAGLILPAIITAITDAGAGLVTMMSTALAEIAPEVLLIGAAVGILAAAWEYDWGGIREKVQAVLPVIEDLFNKLVGYVSSFNFSGIFDTLGSAVNAVGVYLQPVTEYMANLVSNMSSVNFGEIWGSFSNILRGIWNDLQPGIGYIKNLIDMVKSFDWAGKWATIKGIAQAIWDKLKALGSAIWDFVKPAIDWVWEHIKGFWDWLSKIDWGKVWADFKNKVVEIATVIYQFVKPALAWIWQKLQDFWAWLSAIDWGKVWSDFKAKVAEIATAIYQFVKPALEWLWQRLRDFWAWLTNIDWGKAWADLKAKITDLWNATKPFRDSIGDLVTFVQKIDWGKAWDWINKKITDLWNITKPIRDAIGDLVTYIQGIDWGKAVQWLLDRFNDVKDFLGRAKDKALEFVGYLKSIDWGKKWDDFVALLGNLRDGAIALANSAREKLAPAWKWVTDTFSDTWSMAQRLWVVLKSALEPTLASIWQTLKDNFIPVWEQLKELWAQLQTQCSDVWETLKTLGASLGDIGDKTGLTKALLDGLKGVVIGLGTELKIFVGVAVAGLLTALGLIISWFAATVASLGAGMTAIIKIIKVWEQYWYTVFVAMEHFWKNFVAVIQDVINGDWAKAWKDFKKLVGDAITDVWNIIKAFVTGVVVSFTSLLNVVWVFASTFAKTLFTYFKGIYDGLVKAGFLPDFVKGMTDGFSGIFDTIKSDMDLFGTDITKAWDNLKTSLSGIATSLGTDIINVIASALSAGSGALFTALYSAIKNALGSVIKAFGGSGDSSSGAGARSITAHNASQANSYGGGRGSHGSASGTREIHIHVHEPNILGANKETVDHFARVLQPALNQLVRTGY